MWRVLKPGGRLVMADADWGSASVDFDDTALERTLMTFFASKMRPNGYAGRQMFSLARALGARVDDILVEVVPFIHRDMALVPFGSSMTDAAVQQGVVSKQQAERWLGETEKRVKEQRFFATVNMNIVCVRKPQ